MVLIILLFALCFGSQLERSKQGYDSFIQQYSSNSCVVEVFSRFKDKCSALEDRWNAFIALKMTECVYQKNRRAIKADCSFENTSECTAKLVSDEWLTYVAFLQHIDSLCYYFDSVKWEKGAEYMLKTLSTASASILTDLDESQNRVKRIVSEQKALQEEVKSSLSATTKEIKQIDRIIRSFEAAEKHLEREILGLQVKVKENSLTLDRIFEANEEKLAFLTPKARFAAAFYFGKLGILFVLTSFQFTQGIRTLLFFWSGFVYFFECLTINWANFEMFNEILAWTCRIAGSLVSFIVLCLYGSSFKDPNSRIYSQIQGFDSRIEKMAFATPDWVKRYFTADSLVRRKLREHISN